MGDSNMSEFTKLAEGFPELTFSQLGALGGSNILRRLGGASKSLRDSVTVAMPFISFAPQSTWHKAQSTKHQPLPHKGLPCRSRTPCRRCIVCPERKEFVAQPQLFTPPRQHAPYIHVASSLDLIPLAHPPSILSRLVSSGKRH